MPTQPHVCNGCDARFGGVNTCHCAAPGCHETFSTEQNYLRHRHRGKCIPPETLRNKHGERVLKLLDRPYRCWGSADEMPRYWEGE